MHFAAITLPELGSVLGIFVGMLTAFYALVKFMLKNASDDRIAERTERKEFTDALKDLTASTRAMASATERAADEAKQRNGHLAELIIESKGQIIESQTHVDKQIVDKQTIKEVKK